MRRPLFVVMLGVLLGAAYTAHAATTYFLKPDTGLDANPGTLAQPWKTIDKVKASVNPGDTVNVVGGTYNRTQYRVGGTGYMTWGPGDRKGLPNQPITIQSNPGDMAVFDGQQQFYMFYFNATAGPTDYYIIIQNLEFKNYQASAINIFDDATVGPNYTRMNAGYLTVQNNYIHNYYDGGTGAIDTSHAHHVIIRNNRIEDIGFIHPVTGYNCAGDQPLYIGDASQYIVIDNNRLGHSAGYGLHGWAHFTFASHPEVPTTKNNIWRRNTLWNNYEGGIIAAGGVFENLYVYNNTVYSDPTPFPEINQVTLCSLASNNQADHITTHNQGNYQHMVWLNNLSYGTVVQASSWVDLTSNFTGPQRIDYNLWGNLTNASAILRWNSTNYTLPAFQAAFSNVYDAHSLVANPLFVNTATRDFTLQTSPTPSPAINAGTTLTTTTAPCSAQSVPVLDAGFFHDGYGMVSGDTVQIGTQTRTITGVNYATNTLTWGGAALSCASGTAVSLPYNGTAPDMGAWESGTSAPLATQLRFTTPPATTPANQTLAPLVVEAHDASDVLVPSANVPITLTVSGGPGFFPGTSALQTQLFAVPQTGRYLKLVTLADANDSHSTSAAEITVLQAGTPLPQAGMSVVSVSSQESSACCGGPRLATHALDGNTATYWFTQYTGGKLGPPYTLILDLGLSAVVNGWTYLPHQLADPDGHVTQYTLWVSADGTTWGTALTDPQLTGTLTQTAVAGVATFPALVFGTPATTYQLTASSPGLTSAQSPAFAITAAPTAAGVPRVLFHSRWR